MKKKFIITTIRLCAVLFLILLGAALTLRWYVISGRFRALAERRAAKAAEMSVRMESFHFSWPLAVRIEGLKLAAPGHEDLPFLSCEQTRVTASPGDVVRGHLVTLTMVNPKINLVKKEDGFSNIPTLPKREEESRFSIGTIAIESGEIGIDFPGMKASARGIHAALGEPMFSTGEVKVLGLRTDSVNLTLGGAKRKQIPVSIAIIESKFVLNRNKTSTEVEASIESALSARVPYLLLPSNIPISLSFGLDYVPQRDSLENAHLVLKIPLFSNVSAYGAMTELTGGAPKLNMNWTVEAPEIKDLLEYCEPLQRPKFKDLGMTGIFKITGEMHGNAMNPDVSAHASVKNGGFAWKGLALEDLGVETPVSIGAGAFAAGPGTINAAKAIALVKGSRIEVAPLNVAVSADKSHVSIDRFMARVEKTTNVTAKGVYELGSKRFYGNARMDGTPLPRVVALIPPNVYKLPEGMSLGGTLKLGCDFSGKLTTSLESLSLKYNLDLEKGEFSKGEFVSAAGINAKLNGTAESASLKDNWKFDVAGDIGNFEVLVDTFYKAFTETVFPFAFAGEYTLRAKQVRNARATLDLGKMGKLKASGSAGLAKDAEFDMRIGAEKVDIGKVFDEIAQQLLSERFPSFREAKVGGVASAGFQLGLKEERWTAAGDFEMADGRISLDGGKVVVDSLSARLPFGVYFPQGESAREAARFEDSDFGRIELRGIGAGPVSVASLALEVAVRENSLRVRGPIPIALFEGTLTVDEIEGENLLGSLAKLTTSASADGMDLGQITTKLELPKVEGTLDAHFSSILLNTDALETAGAVEANVFGGRIQAAGLGIEKPFSPVRTIEADLTFKDIDLSDVTETLKFGTITGIMDGTLKGLEISQGQAAAFVADFGTVPRKGVPQRINFDAVQNITILGTGQGFQATLGRGFASFFNEFRYDKLGFYCTLKNDNFRMKGKVVEGGTEYFVRGTMLGPSINVINRNPGQTVSFKSMLERINRVKREKEEENPSGSP
ncbi:hypothetical protein HZA56_05060 [Candidatus Poribacteria bacterium]|nr:hypothetical protein [Candidatus Poribacteria bacterium]